jgi:hypothetical protein
VTAHVQRQAVRIRCRRSTSRRRRCKRPCHHSDRILPVAGAWARARCLTRHSLSAKLLPPLRPRASRLACARAARPARQISPPSYPASPPRSQRRRQRMMRVAHAPRIAGRAHPRVRATCGARVARARGAVPTREAPAAEAEVSHWVRRLPAKRGAVGVTEDSPLRRRLPPESPFSLCFARACDTFKRDLLDAVGDLHVAGLHLFH